MNGSYVPETEEQWHFIDTRQLTVKISAHKITGMLQEVYVPRLYKLDLEVLAITFALSFALSKWDHMLTHTEEDPFKCEICHKKLINKFSLKHHMLIHSGVKQFDCDICSRAFLRKPNLEVHMRLHTEEKPNTCNICNKSFRAHYTLIKHSRLHTKEKQST
nr:zinc finger protein 350-like [Penaeus vannamei]